MRINTCIYSITTIIFYKKQNRNFKFFFLLFLGIILANCKAIGQPVEMELKSSIPLSGSANDIWGYTDPFGNEYAIVGLVEGVDIVDINDPENPKVLFFIEGKRSTWRDVKTTPNGYAYVVNESGDGLMIINLNMLPQKVEWDLDATHFSKAHNIYIDEYNIAYIAGSNNHRGFIALDLNNDPLKPEKIGFYETYCHDIYVRENIAYTSEIYRGAFGIIDVRKKSEVPKIAEQKTFNSFTHNVWPSEDGNYLYTTDEVSNGTVGSYDISDFKDINVLDNFYSNQTAFDPIPHNTHVKGNYLYTSHYTEGIQVIDATDPQNLKLAEFYDTYPVDTVPPLFRGCWGAFPFLPSGNIICSDRQNGLFVLGSAFLNPINISGTVREKSTGLKIENARVSEIYHYHATYSDQLGDFQLNLALEDLSKEITVIVEKEGFKSKTFKVSIDPTRFNSYEFLLEKETVEEITFYDECSGQALDSVYVEFYDSTNFKRYLSNELGKITVVNSFTEDYYFVTSKDTFQTQVLSANDINNGFVKLKRVQTCLSSQISENPVVAFPNPVTDQLNIGYNYNSSRVPEEYIVELFDINGKVIYKTTLNSDNVNTAFNLGPFKAGIYFLSYSTDSKTESIRLIKY